MGDPANVLVKSSDGEVYLYTHWSGSELPQVVRGALAKKWRWDDAPYLARIIFCEMVGHNNLEDETGFGISPVVCDGENRVIEIDVDQNSVTIGPTAMTFAEFIGSDIGWHN